MTARRSLLTASAAGSVLFALWFVPSAQAGVGNGEAGGAGPRAASAAHPGAAADGGAATAVTRDAAAAPPLLADTGSPETAPYAIGGAACLALGAGLVGYSVRRRHDAAA
ncbi:hypothetical protein [Streptomyces sp. NPDC053427]|uniref:hypothetical protein n=1 Tax=Streptomyces sp. NPDC053427 TaxID=3365701 RepID=UPI0037D0B53E